jgi:hypothetical protein
MNVEIGRQNSVLQRGPAVSVFLGIHKSEPDLYIGFSPALHLQRTVLAKMLWRDAQYQNISLYTPPTYHRAEIKHDLECQDWVVIIMNTNLNESFNRIREERLHVVDTL